MYMFGSFSMNMDGCISGCRRWLFVHFMIRLEFVDDVGAV